MVTLKDIANELDVSIPLVSKVLNKSRGTTGVSVETAERIRDAAVRLGYTRNRSAAALRMGRHDTLGVMIHRCGSAGSGVTDAALSGVAAAAGAMGQQLELAIYETDAEFSEGLLRMNGSSIDGLVVAGVPHPAVGAKLLDLHSRGVPVVTLYDQPVHPNVVNVGCDDVEVGRIATRHLIDLGCKRIAHIRSFDTRYDGYRQALREAGLELIEALVVDARRPSEVRFDDGVQGAATLLDRGVAFDGLVAGCDLHAAGAIRTFFLRGIRAPDDVRVVGVDDSPLCPYGIVALSSVSGNVNKRARLAVKMLMAARAGKEVASVLVPPTLSARESSIGAG